MKRENSRMQRGYVSMRLAWASWQVLALAGLCFTDTTVCTGATIVQNFAGVTMANGQTLNKGVSVTPPDSMGAVGPNHFVEFVNGAFAIYNKTGGAPTTLISDRDFWFNAGIIDGTTLAAGISDPRITYDPVSSRWFATQINTASTNNQVLVARSNTSDPSGTWKAVQFTGNAGFADYDTLGVDATGVYIGVNNFASSTGSFTGVSLFSIPKADLLAGTPTLANMTALENLNDQVRGFTLQGVSNSGPGPGHGVVIAIDNVNFQVFDRTTINGSGAAGATLSSTVKINNLYDAAPPAVTQPTGGLTVDPLDDRFSGAVQQVGNRIYMANAIGNGGKDAVHWMILDEPTNTVLQEGLISDPSFNFFQPSIAVNANGEVVIGFNRSGSTSPGGNISSYAAVGTTIAGNLIFGAPMLLAQGPVGDFHVSFGGTPNRWGDFSATMVDPTNPEMFWTIQEIPVSSGSWGTQITAILIPEPSALALASLGCLLLAWRSPASKNRSQRQV